MFFIKSLAICIIRLFIIFNVDLEKNDGYVYHTKYLKKGLLTCYEGSNRDKKIF